MNVLLVDNYDSFTHNLSQLVAGITGARPRVVRNDALDLAALVAAPPDAVILSPGPGSPHRDEDVGLGRRLVEALVATPILGVCLGHQIIGVALGGRAVHAPEPMHGRISAITHDGEGLFAGLPQPLRVVRYHSLVLAPESLPPALRVTARTDDGLVMAIAHATRPLCGVQFHPESILTEGGARLLANFLDAARGHRPLAVRPDPERPPRPPRPQPAPRRRVVLAEAPLVDAEAAFVGLYGKAPRAFWLDGTGRFSYMGEGGREVLRSTGERCERITPAGTEAVRGDPFAALEAALLQRSIAAPPVEFELAAGYVGWLGYELKQFAEGGEGPRAADALPDAQLMLADRVLAFDRERQRLTLCFLAGVDDAADAAERWFAEVRARLATLASPPPPRVRPGPPVALRPDRDRAGWHEAVARIERHLRDGDSYEICLTTQVRGAAGDLDPLDLYRILRRENPAPWSAFLRCDDACVLSASPERFVHIDRHGEVETRPIKGTRRRGRTTDEDAALAADLAASDKDRAENLMIVDLVRHDLGGVCAPGSVHVPSLMAIEPHPTVFQMVSTVRGRLDEGVSPVAAVRALFPGGSMTGAPKIRAMKIIGELERVPRGVYSGGIGFFSLDGAVDLAMAIRTIVMRPGAGEISFGVGGAVVALSDADDEFDEAMLKGRALARAIRLARGVED